MFGFLIKWWAWFLAAFLAFGVVGCSLSVDSPGSSFAAEQDLDGSGNLDASGEVHVAWELPVVSSIGDLFSELSGD